MPWEGVVKLRGLSTEGGSATSLAGKVGQQVRRLVPVIFLGLLHALVLGSTTAMASPYSANGVTLSTDSPSPGESVTVTASGFRPSSDVEILFEGNTEPVGSAVANANGAIESNVSVPPSLEPGSEQVLVVRGEGPDGRPFESSVGVTLAQDAESADRSLWTVLLPAGLALVVVAGGAWWALARRRQVVHNG